MIQGEKNVIKVSYPPETCGSAAELHLENLDCGVPAMCSAVCGTLHKKMEEQGNVWAHNVLALVLTACWVSMSGQDKAQQAAILAHLEFTLRTPL